VSISFYGLDAEGKPIAQDVEDPRYLNMCAGNAVALLNALGLKSEVDEDPGIYGVIGMDKVLEAVKCPRMDFFNRLRELGLRDTEYFMRRFGDFEACVNELKRLGAQKVYWG
jgi:hypothetical protein